MIAWSYISLLKHKKQEELQDPACKGCEQLLNRCLFASKIRKQFDATPWKLYVFVNWIFFLWQKKKTTNQKSTHNSVFGTAYWKRQSCPHAGIIYYTQAVKIYV